VAADTLHPQWRELLRFVQVPKSRKYTGHSHDWVVHKRGGNPVSLASTCRRWDLDFTFEHVRESIIDASAREEYDPRQVSYRPTHTCSVCEKVQSASLENNQCQRFPDLYEANARLSYLVPVFQTEDGRNNGLVGARPSTTTVEQPIGLLFNRPAHRTFLHVGIMARPVAPSVSLLFNRPQGDNYACSVARFKTGLHRVASLPCAPLSYF
jgi:hypothetical protein